MKSKEQTKKEKIKEELKENDVQMEKKIKRVFGKIDALIARTIVKEGIAIKPVFYFLGAGNKSQVGQGHWEVYVATEQEKQNAKKHLEKIEK